MKPNPDTMTDEEIEQEVDSLKSLTERMLERDARRWLLEKEKAKRYIEEIKNDQA